MAQFNKDVWIGLFVVLAGFILIATFILFKGLNPYSREVLVSMDSVAGVAKGIKVMYKGYEVGIVDDIAFNQASAKGGDQFIIGLRLKKDFVIYEGTQFAVRGIGMMMGASFIDVVLPEERGRVLAGKVTVPGTASNAGMPDMGKLFDNVNRATRSIFEADMEGKLNSMVTQFDKVGKLADNLAASLQRTIGKVDKTIDKSSYQVDHIMEKLAVNLDSLNVIMENLGGMVGDPEQGVGRTVRSLNQTVEKAQGLLNDIDEVTSKHKDDISEMIVNLKDAAISLNYISKHPRKFIFGGKVKGLKEVEKEKQQELKE